MISISHPTEDQTEFIALVFKQDTYNKLCKLVEDDQCDELVKQAAYKQIARIVKNAISRNERRTDEGS